MKKPNTLSTEKAAKNAERAILDGNATVKTVVNPNYRKGRVMLEVHAYDAVIYRVPFSVLWTDRRPLKKVMKKFRKAIR